MPGEKALLQEPDVLTLTLTAPESYGIDAGQPLILHGVQVGQVIDRKLTSKGVTFTVAIEPQHRELVKGDSKFVVNSRVDVKVGLDGVEFLGASASEWINGGIRILPGDKGEMKASYPLYANLEKALENSLSDLPTTTVSLSAETLPDVQAGSVVLYRKFEVGEVITVRPRANAFDIDLHIKPEYRNLLTSNSVFWAEGGAKVQLNGSGLTVQASPLSRALKGLLASITSAVPAPVSVKATSVFCMLPKQRPVRLAGKLRFTLSMPENWRSGCQFAISVLISGKSRRWI